MGNCASQIIVAEHLQVTEAAAHKYFCIQKSESDELKALLFKGGFIDTFKHRTAHHDETSSHARRPVASHARIYAHKR